MRDELPDEFWDHLREAKRRTGERPPSLLLLSEEPYIPWELALVDPPLDTGAAPFLSAQATVGPWLLDRKRPTWPPRQVRVRDMAVISGIYAETTWARLEASEEEAKQLHTIYKAAEVNAVLSDVLKALSGSPEADVYHFALHGIFDPESVYQGLVLTDNNYLDPLVVRGQRFARAPFIFLNACQVGSGNEVLGNYAGMAEAFLAAGTLLRCCPPLVDQRQGCQGDRPPLLRAFIPRRRARGVATGPTRGVHRDVDFGHRSRVPVLRASRVSFTSRHRLKAEESPMAVPLNARGGEVRIGQTTLRTPGLEGRVDAIPALRFVPPPPTSPVEQALARAGMTTSEVVVIEPTRLVPGPPTGTRGTSLGEPAIELTEPASPTAGQLVLYADESGVLTWHFPVDVGGKREVSRGSVRRTYLIPRRIAPRPASPGSGSTRGLPWALGKKVLRVLVFPLIDPVLGEIGDYFARKWEEANRPYRFRTVNPENYRNPDVSAIQVGDWARLSGGRSLLLIHGTFSQAHMAFGGLSQETVAELNRRYEGRVFALDHFTMSRDPRQNVNWLLEHMPDGASLDLDVLCHSRGGLLARVLSERQSKLSLGAPPAHPPPRGFRGRPKRRDDPLRRRSYGGTR